MLSHLWQIIHIVISSLITCEDSHREGKTEMLYLPKDLYFIYTTKSPHEAAHIKALLRVWTVWQILLLSRMFEGSCEDMLQLIGRHQLYGVSLWKIMQWVVVQDSKEILCMWRHVTAHWSTSVICCLMVKYDAVGSSKYKNRDFFTLLMWRRFISGLLHQFYALHGETSFILINWRLSCLCWLYICFGYFTCAFSLYVMFVRNCMM